MRCDEYAIQHSQPASLNKLLCQTYENATGALWNVGLDVNNTAALQACSAPEFLAQPVPDSWLMDHVVEVQEQEDEEEFEEEEEEEEEEGGGPLVASASSMFLTQAPVPR